MPKQLASQGACTVLKRKVLFELLALLFGDHDAIESSPVLRKCEPSTIELLVPPKKFTPSANRLRTRQFLMSRPLAPGPTQYPVLLCSIQMFSRLEPMPVGPLKLLSEALSSRKTVSPKTEKSEYLHALPKQFRSANAPYSVEYHMPAPRMVKLSTLRPAESVGLALLKM